MNVKLSKRMFHKALPNGEVVVYCPEGSSKPIVLSKLALKVFSALENNVDPLVIGGKLELDTILEHFKSEKIIQDMEEIKGNKSFVNRNNGLSNISFWIHTSDKCNLACDYCYVHKGNRLLSLEMFMEFLDFLYNMISDHENTRTITLKFAGGEPLLNIDLIFEAVRLARKRFEPKNVKVLPIIITNGTLITKEYAHILKELGFGVSVSLDGFGKFNSARCYPNGKSSFEGVISGIDILLQEKLRPGIITVISNQNVSGISEIFDFVVKKNLFLNLSLCREYCPENGFNLDLDLVRRELFPQLERLISLPGESLPKMSFGGISFNGKRKSVCGAGRNYFSLAPSGSLGSCQMTVDNPVVDSFKEVKQLEYLRSKCLHSTQPRYCSNCVWQYACSGGCEILLRRTNERFKKPVFCELMDELLPILLMLQGRYIQQKRSY